MKLGWYFIIFNSMKVSNIKVVIGVRTRLVHVIKK